MSPDRARDPVHDVNAYYAFAVPFCLLLVAGEVALSRHKGFGGYGIARSVCNMSGGLGEVLVVLIGLYVFGYDGFALFDWSDQPAVAWVLAFVLGDLCYYGYHRAGHRVGGFWAIHGVHHQSDTFNYTVAMRHPWFSDVYAFVFYIPLPLAGVPVFEFFVAISVISFYAFIVHTQTYDFPSLGVLVTPGSHIVHHARNPRYLGRNLGAMFCVWDRLFGTYAKVDPDDPPILGPVDGYRSHDGAFSQFMYFGDIIGNARRSGRWWDAVRGLYHRPGWRPEGVPAPVRAPAATPGDVPRRVQVHVLAQFGVISAYALFLLWGRDHHGLWLSLVSVGCLLFSISCLGRLLDGRPGARRWEGARLWVLMGAASLLIGHPDYRLAGALLLVGQLLGFAVLWGQSIGPPAASAR